MENQVSDIIIMAVALLIGGAVGLLFGYIQNAAIKRNQEIQAKGKINSSFSFMPGSMTRVAMLLILLVIIQLTCPIFFKSNIQWFVSGGVVLGYGWTLLKKLHNNTAHI
jgi:uncharacterized BrkB/YihY/UPF0761 family membrane protein